MPLQIRRRIAFGPFFLVSSKGSSSSAGAGAAPSFTTFHPPPCSSWWRFSAPIRACCAAIAPAQHGIADRGPDARRKFSWPSFSRFSPGGLRGRLPCALGGAARRTTKRTARPRRSRAPVTAAPGCREGHAARLRARRPPASSALTTRSPSSAMYKLCLLALVASATGAPPAATAAAAAAPRRAGRAPGALSCAGMAHYSQAHTRPHDFGPSIGLHTSTSQLADFAVLGHSSRSESYRCFGRSFRRATASTAAGC